VHQPHVTKSAKIITCPPLELSTSGATYAGVPHSVLGLLFRTLSCSSKGGMEQQWAFSSQPSQWAQSAVQRHKHTKTAAGSSNDLPQS